MVFDLSFGTKYSILSIILTFKGCLFDSLLNFGVQEIKKSVVVMIKKLSNILLDAI